MIRHRPLQACVIGALSALVTACALVTPLYQRALEQASVPVELDHAPASASQLHLTPNGILPDIYAGVRNARPPLSNSELVALVPPGLRSHFRPAIPATSVVAAAAPGGVEVSRGPLLWRRDMCAHLAMTSGRCPSRAGEIAVSTADAQNFGWQPGMQVPTNEVLPPATPGAPTTAALTVTGVYARPTGRYWDGWALTGASGSLPDLQHVAHDTWVAAEATLTTTPWRNPLNQVDLPLDRSSTGIDELLQVGPAASVLEHAQSRRPSNVAGVRVRSDLPELADRVREGRSQARETVPLLMMPLGVLGLVVLWMALGAAADQRRPEVALARLRGRGVRGARAHLLRELLTVVLAGVPFGVAAALVLGWVARHRVLSGHAPFELRAPVWLALLLAIAAVTATTVAVGARVSREPIDALLRRVPQRRTGWAFGITDAVALTAAIGIVAVFATGRLTGPLALAAPAVLALALGLGLSRAVVPVATAAGRRLLRRGRPGAGVALLQLARRPSTRGVIALLTVSAGILVFAGNAVAVGHRNRSLAAAQQVGAPMVASLGGGTVPAVREALAAAGASPRAVTPVVVTAGTGNDTQTNLFADPAAFARVAALPDGARARLRALRPPDVAPVSVAGSSVSLELATADLETGGQPVRMAMSLLLPDRTVQSVPVGGLPAGTARREVRVPVACAVGCTLIGWQVTAVPASSVTGTVIVSGLSVDGRPVALGPSDDWSEADDADPAEPAALKVAPGGGSALTVQIDNQGRSNLLLRHRWVPSTLPAVVAGSLPDGERGPAFAGTGLDGTDQPMRAVARVTWLPQTGRNATVSSLDLATRSGAALAAGSELQLWFDRADDALLRRVTDALAQRHVTVLQVDRESRALADLRDSASAWSLQLGVLVGIACLLVSALGLLIAGTASWQTRARDLAIIRLNGMPLATATRIALGEQVPAIVIGGIAGAVAGVLSAHFSLPELPLLPSDPPVDLLDLSISWRVVVLLAGATVLASGVLGCLLGVLTARRATFDRVVGPS